MRPSTPRAVTAPTDHPQRYAILFIGSLVPFSPPACSKLALSMLHVGKAENENVTNSTAHSKDKTHVTHTLASLSFCVIESCVGIRVLDLRCALQ